MAARDSSTGKFLNVGKTFKGLTDAEMTRRLKDLAVRKEHNRIVVLPKIVVEVAYNEIQKKQIQIGDGVEVCAYKPYTRR